MTPDTWPLIEALIGAARALDRAMTDAWGSIDGPTETWDAPVAEVAALRKAIRDLDADPCTAVSLGKRCIHRGKHNHHDFAPPPTRSDGPPVVLAINDGLYRDVPHDPPYVHVVTPGHECPNPGAFSANRDEPWTCGCGKVWIWDQDWKEKRLGNADRIPQEIRKVSKDPKVVRALSRLKAWLDSSSGANEVGTEMIERDYETVERAILPCIGHRQRIEQLEAEIARRNAARAEQDVRRTVNREERRRRRHVAKGEKIAQWKELEQQRNEARSQVLELVEMNTRLLRERAAVGLDGDLGQIDNLRRGWEAAVWCLSELQAAQPGYTREALITNLTDRLQAALRLGPYEKRSGLGNPSRDGE